MSPHEKGLAVRHGAAARRCSAQLIIQCFLLRVVTKSSHRNLIKVPVYSHYTCWGLALLSWLASRIVTTLLPEETGLKQEDDQITERCTSKRSRMSPKRLLRPFCWEECGGMPTTQHSYIMYGKVQPSLHPYYAVYSLLESLHMVSTTCIPTKIYWQMFALRASGPQVMLKRHAQQ